MKKAIIFDLDGTLWNALSSICDSWNQTMIRLNKKYRFTVDIIQTHMGLTPEETGPIAFYDETFSDSMFLFKECIKDEIKYMTIHPGKMYEDEEEVIASLYKKYDLYIVSNADKGYVENYLTALHMDKYFKDYVQYGDTNLEKWKNILYIKEKHHIKDLVYVGDTIKDLEECTKANVPFIHAKYGFGKIDNTEYYIDSFKDLPSVVNKIFN
ncbi:MAG: HAD family hydrolase [Bacilli bacterium]